MSRIKQKNLSDSRGNALGINLLKGMMYFPGLRFTSSFIWVVSFFYVLLTAKAGRQRHIICSTVSPAIAAGSVFITPGHCLPVRGRACCRRLR